MRTKQVLAFLGAAALSSLAFAAPPAPVTVSDDGNTVTVYGNTSQVMRLTPEQAEDLAGAFKLQDGRLLRVTSLSNRVYMELDGRRERLLPLSPTEFVGSKSGAQLELDGQVSPGNVKLTQLHVR